MFVPCASMHVCMYACMFVCMLGWCGVLRYVYFGMQILVYFSAQRHISNISNVHFVSGSVTESLESPNR